MATPREDLDRLLENAGWARALGVELVGASEAEDLVQEGSPTVLLHPWQWTVTSYAGRNSPTGRGFRG